MVMNDTKNLPKQTYSNLLFGIKKTTFYDKSSFFNENIVFFVPNWIVVMFENTIFRVIQEILNKTEIL